jgi:hypothetical protein
MQPRRRWTAGTAQATTRSTHGQQMVTTPLIMHVSNDNGTNRVHCSRCGPSGTTTNAAADQAMANHLAEHHPAEWRDHIAAKKR